MASIDSQDHLRQQERLREILEPGEQILRAGSPDRIAHIWANVPAAGAGAFWLTAIGVGIYGALTAAGHRPPVWFWPCAGFFVAVGLFLASAPLQAALGWRNFGQALTSRRLLKHFPALGRTFVSAVYLDSVILTDLKIGVVDRWRGTGTIGAIVSSADRAVRAGSPDEPGITLCGVSNPHEVFRMIDQARQDARGHNEGGEGSYSGAAQPREGCLREILQPDEEILWQGKPDRGAYALEHVPLTAFGGVWLCLAVVFIYMFFAASGQRQRFEFVFWLLVAPFLVIGAYLTLGMPLRAAYGWRNIAYAVTTRRLFLIHGALGKMFYSAAYLDSISTVDLEWWGLIDRLRGTATIRAATVSDSGAGARRRRRLRKQGIEFTGVRNPEEILRIITQGRDQAQVARE
jgi:hypothetical protein